MTQAINVSVSAYNDAELLAGCLASIRDELGAVDIFVVDGQYKSWPSGAANSTDDTAAVCEEWGAAYDPAGPFETERDKHVYRSESAPADEWLLLLDADERLFELDGDVLTREYPSLPRIINAKVYHDKTPVVYWPRLHKPEWLVDINRWDAYIYDTKAPPRTDRVTIIHRHDLRPSEYRQQKYERFHNEDRIGRYENTEKEADYFSNTLDFHTTECPNCGRQSVTKTPYTGEDRDILTQVRVCTAGDRCYTAYKTKEVGERLYLPGNWREGLESDPEQFRAECIDHGWGYAGVRAADDMNPLAVKFWIEREFGEQYVDMELEEVSV